MENMLENMPIGYSFHPTEKDLMLYLSLKVLGRRLPRESVVNECDIYGDIEPTNLFETGSEQRVVYVFTKLKKMSSQRIKRTVAAGKGTWRGSDKASHVLDPQKKNTIIGWKKNFVYEITKTRAKLGYNMTEYSLPDSALNSGRVLFKDYVLCRIKKKKPPQTNHSQSQNNFQELIEGDLFTMLPEDHYHYEAASSLPYEPIALGVPVAHFEGYPYQQHMSMAVTPEFGALYSGQDGSAEFQVPNSAMAALVEDDSEAIPQQAINNEPIEWSLSVAQLEGYQYEEYMSRNNNMGTTPVAQCGSITDASVAPESGAELINFDQKELLNFDPDKLLNFDQEELLNADQEELLNADQEEALQESPIPMIPNPLYSGRDGSAKFQVPNSAMAALAEDDSEVIPQQPINNEPSLSLAQLEGYQYEEYMSRNNNMGTTPVAQCGSITDASVAPESGAELLNFDQEELLNFDPDELLNFDQEEALQESPIPMIPNPLYSGRDGFESHMK